MLHLCISSTQRSKTCTKVRDGICLVYVASDDCESHCYADLHMPRRVESRAFFYRVFIGNFVGLNYENRTQIILIHRTTNPYYNEKNLLQPA